jgi:putative hydrolase of the HAD superfamily
VIKGVIFDLFHTLTGLESEWSDLPVTSTVLGIDRRKWDEVLTLNSHWRVIGELREPFEILRRLAHQVDPSLSEDLIRKAVEIRVARFRHSLARIPAANVEAIRTLKRTGLKVGLVSNADAMEIVSWPTCPCAGLFDVEIFSCDVGLAKPDPAIFLKCVDAMGLRPGECLFVGDGGSNELVGAREAGLKTVFISGIIKELWPERIPQRMAAADHHIEQLPDILKLPAFHRNLGPRP